MPNGSYQDMSTIRSADRSSAGMSSWLTWPVNLTRSDTPRLPASRARSQQVSSRRSIGRAGPPTISSSASGISASARTAVSRPSRRRCVATAISRRRSLRGAIGPSALNRSVSTPNGTTLIELRGTPRLARSDISSVLDAITASALHATARSSRFLAPDSASGAAPRGRDEPSCPIRWRRSAMRSEWNVCTTGKLRSRVPASAASPPVQPIACTTSGRWRCQALARPAANSRTYGSTASSARLLAGPASMCSTRTPPGSSAWPGRSSASLRAYTVTSWPCRASSSASAATRVSWVAGSLPAACVRVEDSSATRAIFMGQLLAADVTLSYVRSHSDSQETWITTKRGGRRRESAVPTPAPCTRTPCECAGRRVCACVVGTAGTDHIHFCRPANIRPARTH